MISTKYSLLTDVKNPNSMGNGRKNIYSSVEKSLKRLNTDYLDVLWIHAWYGDTDPEELLISIDTLIRNGKIRYWGISDAPAWVCSSLYTRSELRGWSKPMAIQLEYNLLERTVENELLPFATYHNLPILAWAPLGGGILSGKHHLKNSKVDSKRIERAAMRASEKNDMIVQKLIEVAREAQVSPSQVAIKWLQSKSSQVFPIIGARTMENLIDNIGASEVVVDKSFLEVLTEESSPYLIFPNNFYSSERTKQVMFGSYL